MATQQTRRLFLLVLSATCFLLLHVLLVQQPLPSPPAPPPPPSEYSVGPLNHVMQATPVPVLNQSSQMPPNVDQLLIMATENLTYSGDSSTPPVRAGAVKRLPQCIIIGARKGGTRALLEFLNLHPGIEKATDEVHFFDDDTKYRMGLDWYKTRMPPSTSEQITIEKSPAYFVTDRVPERMWAMNSSLRLLLIVRDPVVRLISDYAQLAENRRMRRESAGKDKAKVPLFEQVVLTPEGRVNTEYRPVGTSIYAVYFRRWLAYFPRRQIHVIDGDRLIREPFQEVQKVESFLGLSAKISEDAFYFNKTKGFYCVRPPDDIQDHCLNESKGRKHPKVAPRVISRLRQFYAPFNREFYSLAGHDFGWPEV